MFLSNWHAILCLAHCHSQYTHKTDGFCWCYYCMFYVKPPLKNVAESWLIRVHFVAYEPFFVIENYWQDFTMPLLNESYLCTKKTSLEDLWHLAINALIWISEEQFNNLHVKQAALAITKKGWESVDMFNSSAALWVAALFVDSSPCSPQIQQHQSGVSHSPHQTKHKYLLFYCYSTVKASWLHPHNPQTYTQRGGMVFPWGVGLEEHQESKRLCGIFIHRSNYYFFFNSRLTLSSILLITLRC